VGNIHRCDNYGQACTKWKLRRTNTVFDTNDINARSYVHSNFLHPTSPINYGLIPCTKSTRTFTLSSVHSLQEFQVDVHFSRHMCEGWPSGIMLVAAWFPFDCAAVRRAFVLRQLTKSDSPSPM